ncbi:predicted protein [Phaeodactylum tricornutum CCAP 1055/1]|uniref:Polygalacturonase n=1 Tax=Phaeodactylum tricornutum (strain CCAP 1055/1) TaxID=556484 RepID=B5Y3E1_PHATC|nr:predicted protein [Phaeodactylum tricornutum CCAP 1055/1]ACI65105.1 predicted protein [Phaeodactylum tricornutum CCAP 1055/1]|eukprot:XP_002185635.1 predicted protein [Phaeodactylum tricornutum CCAP 1055/1]
MGSNAHRHLELDVQDYQSSQNGGRRDDTAAFEQAIDIIRSNGGGRLIIPGAPDGSFNLYRIRPINLTSHLVLFLQKNAVITAIADESVWPLIPPLPSYGQGRDHVGPRYSSLLHGEYLTNITIRGEPDSPGIIDGQGRYWWDRRRHNRDRYTRGHLVEFMYSSRIRMYNLRLQNSPFWTNHFYDCDDVHVQNVHVKAPWSSPNTDGWDPDSSRNVLIEDSTYRGGDDCVAIKSGWDCFGIDYDTPSENITIRNVTCQGPYAGIAIGTEMSGGVRNVTVENVTFTYANKPANIKTGNTRGGYVHDVVYQNIRITGHIDQAIHVDMYHYHNTPNPSCSNNYQPNQLPHLRDLYFFNFEGTQALTESHEVFHFVGLPESPIEYVFLENISFPTPVSSLGWNCSNVQGSVKNNSVTPWPPCPEFPSVTVENSETMSPWNAFLTFLFLTTAVLGRA